VCFSVTPSVSPYLITFEVVLRHWCSLPYASRPLCDLEVYGNQKPVTECNMPEEDLSFTTSKAWKLTTFDIIDGLLLNLVQTTLKYYK
jgi:hypothetical protein